ncbi:MAG: RsmE family RNA methyltransferase [Phycisphaerae bacterium]|jgi:16S rRNA (uracil1498-N3)-methyltransferase
MQIHRFYCDSINRLRTEILGPEARHAASVLRLSPGQTVEIFDGRGTLATAQIESIIPKKLLCRIENLQTTEKANRTQITIAVSVPKGDRFDWLIAKCTELGIDKIVPVIFERSVKNPKNPKAAERWRNITISAAKQSKRLFLPDIELPLTLEKSIVKFRAESDSQILLGSLEDDAVPLTKIEFTSKNVIAFIGPEGGLTDEETKLLIEAGSKPVRITDTILRIETAAIAFAAILAAARDNLTADY